MRRGYGFEKDETCPSRMENITHILSVSSML